MLHLVTRYFGLRTLAMLLSAITVAGCATLPPAQPARDLKAVAGKWEGTVYLRGGQMFSATMTINEDGTWEIITPAPPAGPQLGPRFVGSMIVVDGKYRYKSETTGLTGTCTLHEGDGKRVFVRVADDGSHYSEFRPAK